MGDERKYFLLGVQHPLNIPFAQMMNQSVWEPRQLDLGFNLCQHPWLGSSPSPLQVCSFSPLSKMQVNAHRQCKAPPHSTARWHWVLMRALASSTFSCSNPDCVSHWNSWYSCFQNTWHRLISSYHLILTVSTGLSSFCLCSVTLEVIFHSYVSAS